MNPDLKQMPQSLEAETAVLGSVFLDPVEALETALGLNAGHFYTRSNMLIFQAIWKLHQDSKPIDLITVTNHLRDSGELESVGGAYYLSRLSMAASTAANIEHYIDILKEKKRLRDLLMLAAKIEAEAYGADDAKDLISNVEAEVFSIGSESNVDENHLQPACVEIKRQIDLWKKGERVTGLLCGIPSLDETYYGLQPGQYYVIGGVPSSGKSALADQIVGNVLSKGHAVLYISLESSRERVVGKLAAKRAEIIYTNFSRGRLNPEQLLSFERGVDFFSKSNLLLHKPSDLTGSSLRSLIRREKRRNNIALVVVDYIQKINAPNGWDERRAIGDCSKQLQNACTETGIPAVVIAQLNRESVKADRPRMQHLKECSQIEQDADNIMLLWTQENVHELAPGQLLTMTCSIEKNKDGPNMFDLQFLFDRPLMTFREQTRTSNKIYE